MAFQRHIDISSAFSCVEDAVPSEQLAFRNGNELFVTLGSLKDYVVVDAECSKDSTIAWTFDGAELIAVKKDGWLAAHRFRGREHVASRYIVDTSGLMASGSRVTRHWADEGGIYCVAEPWPYIQGSRTQLWRISLNGANRQEVCPAAVDSVCNDFSGICDVVPALGMLLIAGRKYASHGTIMVVNFRDGSASRVAISPDTPIAEPRLSPCGRYCIYRCASKESHQLFLYEFATGCVTALGTGSYGSCSPDASRIASTFRNTKLSLCRVDGTHSVDIVSWNEPSSDLRSPRYGVSPLVWSGDGLWLAGVLSGPCHGEVTKSSPRGFPVNYSMNVGCDRLAVVVGIASRVVVPMDVMSYCWAWR